jgi:hypothetical protein
MTETKFRVVADHDRSVAEFISQGEHLYEKQRVIVRDIATRHNLDRAKVMDDFRRRFEDLAHEEMETLRRFDHRARKELDEAKAQLEALERLRGE